MNPQLIATIIQVAFSAIGMIEKSSGKTVEQSAMDWINHNLPGHANASALDPSAPAIALPTLPHFDFQAPQS
jgi:hypothetical protein